MRFHLAAVLCLVAVTTYSVGARAAERDHYVNYSMEVSIPITAALFGLAFSAEFYKKTYAPKRCRWCARNPFDESVRKVLEWNYSEHKTAHMISNIVLASIPIMGLAELAFFNDEVRSPTRGEWNGFATAGGVYAETLAISLALNQVSKLIFMRRRPYARSYRYRDDDDANVSFYSGHTSTAFVLAVAAATLNDMKGGSYRGLTWSVNILMATLVGYLRISADKHFFTDVVVGGLVGGLIGYFVPKLLHEKESDSSSTKSNMNPFAPPPKPVMFGFGIPF